jgi:hypothetical protein
MGAKRLNISATAPKLASFVGAERYQPLAGRIVFLQECKQSYRQRPPPVRVASETYIAGTHVRDFRNLRQDGFDVSETSVVARAFFCVLSALRTIPGVP